MAFTNADVQSMIATYGDRIFYMQFNNNYRIHIGYKTGHVSSVADIKFNTVNGVDMIGFEVLPPDEFLRKNDVHFTSWHLTELLEQICIIDAGWENYRVDPLILN